ncbi:hypothetical protein HR060_11845 [Catenovulum sp. SM1970]|uniref:hypothetical protein n=1 Tax=Marinifaba aquimaris TaxID=2741323 RepID=UPI00157186C9|nr:hypothetical protein [Marinifaba aquimaris]NTS77556.1 hypothetical protein [Marinifaba aquimaris]
MYKSALILGLTLLSTSARADSVAEIIQAALSDYNGKNYSATVENLSMALQLANQEKSQKLAKILPSKIAGWTADEVEYNYAQSLMYGGSVNIERYYYKEDANIKLTLQSDSPQSQKMLAMLANPLLIKNRNSQMTVVNGNRGAIAFDDYHKNGQLDFVVADKYVVSLEGYQVSRSELKKFADKLSLTKLKQFK